MERKENTHDEFVRGFATRAVHVGQAVDPATGAVVAPIHVSSTYEVYTEYPPVILSYNTLEIHLWTI
jgi:hypothetical protein